MRKLLTALLFSTIFTSAQAITPTTAVVITSAAVASANATRHSQQQQTKTYPIDSLIGKKIENCLVLSAYYDSYDMRFEVVCLNANEDFIYSTVVRKPRGDFSKEVFRILRESFEEK